MFPLLLSGSVNSCDPLFLWTIALKWFCLKVGYHKIQLLIIPLTLFPSNCSVFRPKSGAFSLVPPLAAGKAPSAPSAITKCSVPTKSQGTISGKGSAGRWGGWLSNWMWYLNSPRTRVAVEGRYKKWLKHGWRWFDPISAHTNHSVHPFNFLTLVFGVGAPLQEIVHRLQIQALRNPYARTWCQRQIDQALEQVEAQYQARGPLKSAEI